MMKMMKGDCRPSIGSPSRSSRNADFQVRRAVATGDRRGRSHGNRSRRACRIHQDRIRRKLSDHWLAHDHNDDASGMSASRKSAPPPATL